MPLLSDALRLAADEHADMAARQRDLGVVLGADCSPSAREQVGGMMWSFCA